jgi:hypothetical protein
MVFVSFSINLIYQFWVHTERIGRMWPPFEFVFNTPSHHRVHRGMDPEYLDKNYGGIVIVWDRLFGTFRQETIPPALRADQTGQYVQCVDIADPRVSGYRSRSATRPRDGLGYISGPPGWEHALTEPRPFRDDTTTPSQQLDDAVRETRGNPSWRTSSDQSDGISLSITFTYCAKCAHV